MRKKSLLCIIISIVLSLTCAVNIAFADIAFAADKNVTAAVPKATEVKRATISGKTLTICWDRVKGASGYEIHYANNRLFMNRKVITVTKGKTVKKTIKNVSMGTAYVKVRAYKKVSVGKKVNTNKKSSKGNKKNKKKTKVKTIILRSNWAYSTNCKLNKTAKITRIKKDKDSFELRELAKEKTRKFDTLQGGTARGKYGWFVLFDREKSKCKVIKVNLDKRELVNKSGELNIPHGNDIAYNPERKQLVICHGQPEYKQVTVLDSSSFRQIKNVTLTLPNGTPGASKEKCNEFEGITSIAYNEKHKVYVTRLKSQGNVVLYDQNFKAKKYIRLSKKDTQLYQALDTVGDYIMILQSPLTPSQYNRIMIYDWNGQFMSTINLSKKYEAECLFHRNGKLYAGYYYPYQKIYYIDKFKIKVVDGNEKKVKTKLKLNRFVRDNYIYKIDGL